MSAPTSVSAVNPSAPSPAQPVTDSSTATSTFTQDKDGSRGQSSATAASSTELASTKIKVAAALRRFPNFPIDGIDFIDILPLFKSPSIFESLLRVLELQVAETFGATKPDVIVGLDARGFLFGPPLALRLNAAFVPVRKKGKVPGPCVTAAYEKEYGTDFFQMQQDGIDPGQKVLVVDDIIATGGSAAAAGSLVSQLKGDLMGYLFIIEIAPLKGREKLGGKPTVVLLDQE